jgi:hypothetical protein
MEYKVSWTIDLDAGSPEEAARQALEIHRDPESWATHFEVRDGTGQVCDVDLGFPAGTQLAGTVYVLVPMEEGIVRGVQVFKTPESAAEAEAQWLAAHELTEDKRREEASDWGTGIAIWECNLNP